MGRGRQRRWYNQPRRDDFIIHRSLGLATVRKDAPDGSRVYSVQSGVEGHPGLYLTTGITVTEIGGAFTTSVTSAVYPDLPCALAATVDHLPGTRPAYAA